MTAAAPSALRALSFIKCPPASSTNYPVQTRGSHDRLQAELSPDFVGAPGSPSPFLRARQKRAAASFHEFLARSGEDLVRYQLPDLGNRHCTLAFELLPSSNGE